MTYDFNDLKERKKEDKLIKAIEDSKVDNSEIIQSLEKLSEVFTKKISELEEKIAGLELTTNVTTEKHEHTIETKDIDLEPVIEAIQKNKTEVNVEKFDDSKQIEKLEDIKKEFTKLEKRIDQLRKEQVTFQKAGKKTDPSEFIPVRLTNGKKFYEAVSELATAIQRVGVLDNHGRTITVESNYKQLIEYDANDNPIYVGMAEPSTATGALSWQIKKITYDANNNPTAVEWADGNDSFDNKWDERATYTYS